ncbi:uncharacterized protein LOC131605747 [Vicia villosa]|uniref:uncharacterized protein LOC131605747 n=1 Tax=Vicia villosa TaxID=3911 RepID=UPI00273AC22C|nr:uncharacterized protein LOC131605747 [Vicia villosa]
MYAIGGNLSMNAVKNYMAKEWNFVKLPEIFYNDEGYFILKFKTDADREEVMMKGPYTIRNMPMVLMDWRPDFSMERDMLRTVPIWVKLPRLLLHMWGERSLCKIGSIIGTPMFTDECTTTKLRFTYARILVEVDLTQKLCEEIIINYDGKKRKQRVEYEWRPQFCERCQKVGHVCERDKKPHKSQRKEIQDPTEDNPHKKDGMADKPEDGGEWAEVLKGLRTKAKQKEINSRLLKLQPSIAILLETRVKKDKAGRCRRNMGNRWKVIDNYSKHDNGRIWVLWDENKITVKVESMTDQMVHCGVYNTDGEFVHWITTIYPSNILDRRKELWKDMGNISKLQQGPWIAMEDFNNVLGMQDRIGGRAVQEQEFKDLRDMMENERLFEIESKGERFTWYNKHTEDPIYSCIDRVIGNMEWIQKNMNKTVHMLELGVSDHVVVCIQGDVLERPKTGFKFINVVTGMTGYNEEVTRSWQEQSRGVRGNRLWQKLMRLQPVLKKLNRPILSIKSQLQKKRVELNEVQNMVR